MGGLRLVPLVPDQPDQYRLHHQGGVHELPAVLARLREEGWDLWSVAVTDDGPPKVYTITVRATVPPPAPALRLAARPCE